MADSGLPRSTRIAQRPGLIVNTTDPPPEKKQFGPVSKWGKEELNWLNVAFVKETFDLNRIPGFEATLTPEFQDGIFLFVIIADCSY